MSSNTTLPNPYTPLAFLTEDVARKHTIAAYFAVGSLGVLIWDIIIHLSEDFILATKYRINIPFVVYCISRLSGLGYLSVIVVVATAPIRDCSMVHKLNFIYSVAMPSTLLLFVFRVCALYRNKTFPIVFFSSLWTGLLVASIIMPFGVSAYKISFTGYCVEVKTTVGYAMVELAPFVHDTIIFLATSWVFLNNSYQDISLRNGFKVLILGQFLPALSKTILRDGQFYYLCTLILNIIVIVSYRLETNWLAPCTFAVPLFVLMNTLAGHIYRNVRLKVYTDNSITTSSFNRNAGRMGATTDASGTGIHHSSSNRSLDGTHKLEIVFQRSVLTSTSTMHDRQDFVDENSTGVGGLDLEKQGAGGIY